MSATAREHALAHRKVESVADGHLRGASRVADLELNCGLGEEGWVGIDFLCSHHSTLHSGVAGPLVVVICVENWEHEGQIQSVRRVQQIVGLSMELAARGHSI